MSDEIIKVLDDLSERFGVAIDWSAENVLPYAQELFQKFVNYEIWTSVLYIVIALMVFILCIWTTKKLMCDDDWGILIFTFFPLVFSVTIAGAQAIDIITALTFPEKLLFDYINNMQ